MTDHVLVPVDGSSPSDRAFEYAVGLSDVRVTLLTVVDPFDIDPERPGFQSPLGRAGMPAYSQEWYEAPRDEAAARHEEMRESVDADVPVDSAVVFGTAVRRILQYAEDHDVDHVVVGTHGRRNVSRVLLGSVAETVVRRSPAP